MGELTRELRRLPEMLAEIDAEESNTEASDKHPSLADQLRGARIVVVDDHPDTVRLLKAMLSKGGYERVDSFTCARRALRHCERNDFDLLLLDLQMPDLNGLTFMRRLRRARSGVFQPILAITAQDDAHTRVRALEGGAQDFLGKPFDRVEALVRIRNLLQVALLQGRLHRRNVDLERLVEERSREIERTRLQVIRRLARATEYRDPETGAHILRMSHYAHTLSREVGFDEAESQLILDASPMHDIGKVGIPDRILFKPGPLSPAERKSMESHTVIGAEILAGETGELLRLAREIALTHHERWDGTGYPYGLRGEDIPRSGRVAAVCDVFDALTSTRPYRPAWSVEEALAEIRESSGSHFEPVLVEALMDVLPQILEIHRTFQDSSDDLFGSGFQWSAATDAGASACAEPTADA